LGKNTSLKVPQMPNIDQPPPNLQMQADAWIDYIQKVILLFEQMTESDKEEYFKLHNKYNEHEHVLQGISWQSEQSSLALLRI
jgi:hypothetical protein